MPFVQTPLDPQNLNRYSYVVNNPQNYIDPDGYFHRHKKKKHGFWGSIFGGVFGFFLGGPVGAIIGGGLGVLNDFVPEVRTAFRVLEIIGGIGMMLSGNPAGLLFVASGGLGFCQNTGCQISSAMLGFAGGLSGPSGAGSGGAGGGGVASSQSPGIDFPAGGFGGLMLVQALGGKSNPKGGNDEDASPWQSVFATREGLVGHRTASGRMIREDSRFVALPDRSALNRWVEVRHAGRSVTAQVWDVGPWNIDDPYWLTNRVPNAELGIRTPGLGGPPRNPAGIDLSNQVFRDLGMRDNGWVAWRFLER